MIKTAMIVNLIVYSFIYLIISYIDWVLYNPVQWIIDLPKLNQYQRFAWLLLLFIIYAVAIRSISQSLIYHKNTKSC